MGLGIWEGGDRVSLAPPPALLWCWEEEELWCTTSPSWITLVDSLKLE